MADDALKSDLKNTWESAAPGWAKWEHVFAESFAQATDTLIDMAGVGPGMRVLDIASGGGSQSIAAARRVGTAGTVLASDLSATMLEHVRANAAGAGLENIETLESAADELSSELGPFDAAICRMGLMLFPAPGKALVAVREVLKPGARFAALVFTTPANSPFLSQPMAILRRHAGKPAPGPGQPGIFALGGSGVLEGLMADNGFTEIETKTVRARLTLQSASDGLQLLQEAAGAYRAVVSDLDEDAKAKAWDEVFEALKQLETADGFEAHLEAVIGSGVKPA